MSTPDFKKLQPRSYTEDEMIIIRFHNTKEYIIDHLRNSDFILTEKGREKNDTLQRLNSILIENFTKTVKELIEKRPELLSYYETIVKIA